MDTSDEVLTIGLVELEITGPVGIVVILDELVSVGRLVERLVGKLMGTSDDVFTTGLVVLDSVLIVTKVLMVDKGVIVENLVGVGRGVLVDVAFDGSKGPLVDVEADEVIVISTVVVPPVTVTRSISFS